MNIYIYKIVCLLIYQLATSGCEYDRRTSLKLLNSKAEEAFALDKHNKALSVIALGSSAARLGNDEETITDAYLAEEYAVFFSEAIIRLYIKIIEI